MDFIFETNRAQSLTPRRSQAWKPSIPFLPSMRTKFVALVPLLLASLAGVSAAEKSRPNIVVMKSDWRETTNAHDRHPEVVSRLKATATKLVRDGRSTPGAAQKNDGPPLWPELTWIPDAANATKSRAKGKNKKAAGSDSLDR